jgi:hypothetical protein
MSVVYNKYRALRNTESIIRWLYQLKSTQENFRHKEFKNTLLKLCFELQHLPSSKGHWKVFQIGSAGKEMMTAKIELRAAKVRLWWVYCNRR